MSQHLLDFDTHVRRGFGTVVGIDEAGRGPLAGPLVAAALVLPPGILIQGVDDSKKLTDRRRRSLFTSIMEHASCSGLGIVSPSEIDEFGMAEAVRLSFRRAAGALSTNPDMFLVDGNPVKGLEFPCRFIVRGDGRSQVIASASIVAKVSRDDMMLNAHQEYPAYGFDSNKGYGTAAHLEAIREHGPCPLHRFSFSPLRQTSEKGQLSLDLGTGAAGKAQWKQAEEFVVRQLESQGWKLEERNLRWRGGEVDIIVSNGDLAAFVEVKLASPGSRAKQLEKLDPAKIGRIVSAAVHWIGRTGYGGGCRFDLALVNNGARGFTMDYFESAFTPPDSYLI